MKPRYSRNALRLFEAVFGPFRRHHIASPRITGIPHDLPDGVPVILVANHVSWWDGFILRDIHRSIRPAASFGVLMTREELRRRPWLRRLGAIGIEPGSARSTLLAFRSFIRMRRADANATFLFFPQGAIWPSTRRPLGFHRGIATLADWMAPVVLLPVAIHMEPLNRRQPTPFVAIGAPIHARIRPALRALEAAVEERLDAIHAFVEHHGEQATERWPGLFENLPAPTATTGASPPFRSTAAGRGDSREKPASETDDRAFIISANCTGVQR